MPDNAPTLQGKRAAITGASSGIGKATARRLAEEGMDLALGARRVKALEALAGELEADHGVQVVPIELDVTSWETTQAFAEGIEAHLGGLDLVFANAGTGGRGTVDELAVDQWEETIATNLTGAFHTAKATLPLLADHQGTGALIFTASVSGTMGMAGGSAYCASKWGLRGFAQSLALEVADAGIRVTTINPGFVNTRWHEGHPRAEEMTQPEDLAQLVVDLFTLPATSMIDDVTVWPARMYAE